MTKKQKYSSPYLARDYFSKDILPHTLYAGRKTIRQGHPFRQHEDILFLLVRSGSGTVTVNERQYAALPGSLFCLSPAHFYQIEPDKGAVLDVSECHVNAGVFFYITACPYYTHSTQEIPVAPVYARLPEDIAAQAEETIDALAENCAAAPIGENQPAFFLLMKLFGILEYYQ